MADKGFLIKDELASVGATLVLPKFLQGKKQFNKEEAAHNKKVASLPVHVERSELRTGISWIGNLPSHRPHWLQILLLFYLHSPIFYPL